MKYVTKCRGGLLQKIQESSEVLWRSGLKPTEYGHGEDGLLCLHEDEACLDLNTIGIDRRVDNDEFVSVCAKLKPKMAYITENNRELLGKIREGTSLSINFRNVSYYLLLENSQLYFTSSGFAEGALCVDNKTFLEKCEKYPREKTTYTFQRLETVEIAAYSYDEAYEKAKDRSVVVSSRGPWTS